MRVEVIDMEHTFVICAYKESPYLENCIDSLLSQSVKSYIIMATSTPNDYIIAVADKYKIPLFVKDGLSDIADDWNFAYSKVTTPYLTIAHQDDIYLSNYTEHVIKEFNRAERPLIYFSDYGELRNGKVVTNNKLLNIKRIMLFPMRTRIFFSNIWVRRRILSLGSPICCPSVAYARGNLPNQIFNTGFRSNEDWEAWEKISRLQGEFIFDKEILIYHRIHEESETSSIINDGQRSHEDMEMYRKFWPKPIARWLTKLYASGQKSNELK